MVLVISGIALFGFGFVGEMLAGMREEVRALQREMDQSRPARPGRFTPLGGPRRLLAGPGHEPGVEVEPPLHDRRPAELLA